MTQRPTCGIVGRPVLRRLAGLAVAAAGLVLAFGAGAQAGYVPNPACAAFTQGARAPSWNDSYFKGLTRISASPDGTTGVFFLIGPQGKLVLKFEDRVNAGAVVSRRILTGLNVPVDAIVADYQDAKTIRKIFDGMVGAFGRNQGLVPTGNQARFKQLAEALDLKFKGAMGTPPQQLVVTELLPAYTGADSLGSAMAAEDRLSRQLPGVKAKQFIGAAQALNIPENQNLLGYLYVTDALLGNHDRLARNGANRNNIFLAAGTNGTPCLVAIDNEAHAPGPAYMALARYAFSRRKAGVVSSRDVPLVRANNAYRFLAPAPAGSTEVLLTESDLTREFAAETVEIAEDEGSPITSENKLLPKLRDEIQGRQLPITGADYLTALMGFYEDDFSSRHPRHSGPRNIFDGTMLDADAAADPESALKPDRTTPADADTCLFAFGDGPAMIPGFVRRHLRGELVQAITANAMAGSMKVPLGDNRQTLAGGAYSIALRSFGRGGRDISKMQIDSVYDFHKICMTRMTFTPASVSRDGPEVEVVIDWAEFDKNFRAGVQAAMADIGDKKTMAALIGNGFKGMKKLPKLSDVSTEGLLARATFMAGLGRGTDPDTILREMLGGRLKGSYSKDATFPESTYVWLDVRDKEMWVPK